MGKDCGRAGECEWHYSIRLTLPQLWSDRNRWFFFIKNYVCNLGGEILMSPLLDFVTEPTSL